MADETTQAGEETSWWVFDAFADSELPSTSFDEPLDWPETLDWGDVGDSDAELQFPGAFDLSAPIFPTDAEVQAAGPAPVPEASSSEAERTVAVAPLAALGGGAAPGARQATGAPPDSIWAADRPASGVLPAPLGATTIMAELDRDRGAGWRRRFDLRHGNAAVIALISFVSLVLLGMFMSVRARSDVPTDSSQTRTTSDQIAVERPLNTIPLTIPNTTLGPPSTINIADLIPAAEDATSAGAATGSGGTAATTGTTPAPRAAVTTQPAAQPTNTTAATAPVETTTPTPTTQPVDSTTVTTRQTTTSVPMTTRTTIDFTDFTIPGGHTIPSVPRRSGN